MVHANEAITLMRACIQRRPSQAIHLSGPPGIGKTAMVYAAANDAGLPEDRVLLLRPSLMDPVDLLGVPSIENGVTSFCPPAALEQFKRGSGPGLILIDELPQASLGMQNALGGLLLDGVLGGLRLDPAVARISTGNRVQDKAGATRILSQIGNRICHVELGVSFDDWSLWAMREGIDPGIIAFLKLRPALLHDFEPDRISNPTPRSWEMVSRLPPDLPDAVYHAACAGLVGEGAAAEWIRTRALLDRMPNPEQILADPNTETIPEDPLICYAIATALAQCVSQKTFDSGLAYIERMPAEFQGLFMALVYARDPALPTGAKFQQWARENIAQVF